MISAEALYLRYIVKSGAHSSCAIIAQGVAGEDEVAQPGVCIDVLCKGCGAGRPQPLPFQVQPLQGCVACRRGQLLEDAPPCCCMHSCVALAVPVMCEGMQTVVSMMRQVARGVAILYHAQSLHSRVSGHENIPESPSARAAMASSPNDASPTLRERRLLLLRRAAAKQRASSAERG